MDLQVNRWGNSLAVRLPAQLARQLGLEAGSQVSAELTPEGALKLSPRAPLRPASTRAELLAQIAQLHQQLPLTQPVPREEWSRY
ncbi:MAG: AbrB/MazE/SpoVT family DNA-binding domain-containing protein [Betaproteobacteria bacterium]